MKIGRSGRRSGKDGLMTDYKKTIRVHSCLPVLSYDSYERTQTGNSWIKKEATKKNKNSFIKKMKSAFLLLFSAFTIFSVIYGSINWCEYTELFKIDSLEIIGCSILTSQEIIEIVGSSSEINILDLDISSIQTQLEELPYIKAAIVSKHFPNHLKILIKERVPICYINHDNLALIDEQGIALPLPKKHLENNLPVISGFDSDSLIYEPGHLVPNKDLLKLVSLISKTMHFAPELYSNISEIHYQENGNYKLYTINGGTPIYLGKENIAKKINILAQFQFLLHNKRYLNDYQYIDLRLAKQIIAMEKHT